MPGRAGESVHLGSLVFVLGSGRPTATRSKSICQVTLFGTHALICGRKPSSCRFGSKEPMQNMCPATPKPKRKLRMCIMKSLNSSGSSVEVQVCDCKPELE